jgi:hypothetical protein
MRNRFLQRPPSEAGAPQFTAKSRLCRDPPFEAGRSVNLSNVALIALVVCDQGSELQLQHLTAIVLGYTPGESVFFLT